MLRPLLHQAVKQLLCLFLNISKVRLQLAAYQQIGVKYLFMLPNIPHMPMSPYADMPFFFFVR